MKHLGGKEGEDSSNYTILQLGPARRAPLQMTVDEVIGDDQEEDEEGVKEEGANRPMSKRQKHKMTKMNKGKYRDQDEEERSLRLQLLGSEGNSMLYNTSLLSSPGKKKEPAKAKGGSKGTSVVVVVNKKLNKDKLQDDEVEEESR
jgi:hypothetical protein